ncbi:unnamed protein product [Moneuplotes crassus]|uniref:Uncharacterized protein n=1 Tax=Euplotes crassus TaxID=5936 RepID=A0AAD1XEY8_EUPCR|nr:unnamed protein product [Moneuplotes crassus]
MNYNNHDDQQPLNANNNPYQNQHQYGHPDQYAQQPQYDPQYSPQYQAQPAPNQMHVQNQIQPNHQQMNQPMYQPPTSDMKPNTPPQMREYMDEDDREFMKEIRRGFIIKVYSILVFCLGFTALLCIGPIVSKSVQDYLESNIWILITAAILSFVPLCILMYFIKVARRVPLNYILLLSFVFFQSIVVAYACASVGNAELVLIAALMTGGLTLILTIFACTTKIDFTLCWGAVFVLAGTLLLFGIFSLIFRSQVLNIVYVSLGIIVYGFYLLIDTQLVCGGKTWQLSEEDYIIGALILYIDIIVLFLKILALLSKNR